MDKKLLTFDLAIKLPFNTPIEAILEDAEISTIKIISLKKLSWTPPTQNEVISYNDDKEFMEIGIEIVNGFNPDPQHTIYKFLSSTKDNHWPIRVL